MGDVIVTGAHNRAYACAEYCRMNNLPQLEEVLQECHDKIVELKQKIWEYECQDTWLPIDRSQSQSGKGCFDGQTYLFLLEDGNIATGYAYRKGDRKGKNDVVILVVGTESKPTHYRPIPSGWIGGV